MKQADPDHYSLIATSRTLRGARTMALDEAAHRVYLVTADFKAPPARASAPAGQPARVPGTF